MVLEWVQGRVCDINLHAPVINELPKKKSSRLPLPPPPFTGVFSAHVCFLPDDQ